MQNYWNLYVACKQQQLYGPVNYRDFRETGPRNLNWSGKNTLSLAPCKVIRILESETFLLVECGNLGIHQKESHFRLTRLEFEIPIPLTSYPESTAWTPESKSVRIIFLGANCWNKVRHTDFLRPITKWELKKNVQDHSRKGETQCQVQRRAWSAFYYGLSCFWILFWKVQVSCLSID